MNVVSLCCRPFVGNLADKISKYRLSTIGSLLMIVACVGYIFAPTPAVVVGARIINGVGFSLCSVCMATWISSLLPKERVGAGMGLYGTMTALAMAIAPALGIAVYGSFGYRAAFVLATVLAVAVVVTVQLVHDKGEVVQKSAPAKGRGSFVARDVLPVAAIIMLFANPFSSATSPRAISPCTPVGFSRFTRSFCSCCDCRWPIFLIKSRSYFSWQAVR